MGSIMKRKYTDEEVKKLMVGRIYFNPDDANIFVRRRGIGSWTMNMGNVWSWVINAGVIILTYIVVRIF